MSWIYVAFYDLLRQCCMAFLLTSNSALHMAAWQNKSDVVELLLKNGSKVVMRELVRVIGCEIVVL